MGRHAGPSAADGGPAARAVAALGGQSVVIAVVAALGIATFTGFCLARLSDLGVVHWRSLLLVPGVLAAALGVLAAVAVRGPRGQNMPRVRPVIAAAVVLALSVTGFLTRLSLGSHGQSSWSQPLFAAIGFAALFLAIEIAIRFRRRRDVNLAAAVTVILLAALQFFGRHGRQVVLPGGTTWGDWPEPFLALCLLGVLALVLTSPRAQLAAGAPRRMSMSPATIDALRLLLPAGVALAFFAFTRDFGTAVVLFIAGLALYARTTKGPGTPLAVATVAVSFAAGVFLVTFIGTWLGYPNFTPGDILASGPRFQYTLLYGHEMMIGPGFDYVRNIGPFGYGLDILQVIGRETGLVGLVAVGLLFLGLIITILGIANRADTRVGSALALGLGWFIAGQACLAVINLVDYRRPIGTGPPLLAGGAPDYIAVLIAVGAAVGLGWRIGEPPAGNDKKAPSLLT